MRLNVKTLFYYKCWGVNICPRPDIPVRAKVAEKGAFQSVSQTQTPHRVWNTFLDCRVPVELHRAS